MHGGLFIRFLLYVVLSTSVTAQGLVGPPATCTHWVATNGSAGNSGTQRSSPWTLDKAGLASGGTPAGATVCLLSGTYSGGHIFSANGTISQPISVQSAPGEWAVIDQPNGIGGDASVGGTAIDRGDDPMWIEGTYVYLHDTEIRISNTNRRACRRLGVTLVGLGTRAYNNIIHDAGVGIFASESQQGGELYGNVLYNNGWIASSSTKCTSGDLVVGPTGYGTYMQNATTASPKTVEDNIFTHNYNYGVHGYSSDGTKAKGFSVNRNAFLSNGDQPAGASGTNLFMGGKLTGISLTNNYFYKGGLDWGGNNSLDISITNSIFNLAPLQVHGFQTVTFTGNKINGGSSNYGFAAILNSDLTNAPNWTWNNNAYYNTQAYNQPFNIQGLNSFNLAGWRSNTGFDSTTLLEGGDVPQHQPTGLDYAVYPNKYQQGRANIFISNWDRTDTVTISLVNSGLSDGQSYEIRDAQNIFGAPVLTGTYNFSAISLPMTGVTVAAPYGDVTPTHTDKEFGAFVLLPTTSFGSTLLKGSVTVTGKVVIHE